MIFPGIIRSSYSDEWKNQRAKALQILRYLGYGKTITEDNIKAEAASLIARYKRYGSTPFNPAPAISTSVSNVICALLFGERYSHDDDEFVRLMQALHDVFEYFVKSRTGDFIPVLRFLPSYKRAISHLRKSSELLHDFIQMKIEERRRGRSNLAPDGPNDFIECYLKELSQGDQDKISAITEDRLPMLVHDLLIAGTETISTTLTWSLLWMAKVPEVQRKIHEQLDNFTAGAKYEFNLSDREKLPYVEATLVEIQRISYVVPLAVEYLTTEEVEIQGYRLPKGQYVSECYALIELYSLVNV